MAKATNLNKQAHGLVLQQKTVTAATTLTTADSGKTIIWTPASGGGYHITLPKCQAGLHFKFLIKLGDNGIGNSITIGNTDDYFFGRVTVYDSNTDNEEICTQSVAYATTTLEFINVDNDSNTTGGTHGDVIYVEAIDANAWAVSAMLGTTGSPGTIATLDTATTSS